MSGGPISPLPVNGVTEDLSTKTTGVHCHSITTLTEQELAGRNGLLLLLLLLLLLMLHAAVAVVFVCWLVAKRPSNMLVYLRDGFAQTILRAATLK